ncbi:MAG TPA: hypothetical protein VHY08_07135 [Bacillota bacterium]|nr:hypothetical protein [Bacillota bacterium]
MEGSKTAFVLDDIRAQFKVFGESLDMLGNEMKEKIVGLREKGKEEYRNIEAPTRQAEGRTKKE